MAHSTASLLGLPHELRDHIYSYLDFDCTYFGGIRLGPDDVSESGNYSGQILHDYTNHSSTCRTIYHDTAPFFWQPNKFRFQHTAGARQPRLCIAAGNRVNSITLETPNKWSESHSDPMAVHIYRQRYTSTG